MLTGRGKAYSSSCSQTVSLSPAISSSFGVTPFEFMKKLHGSWN